MALDLSIDATVLGSSGSWELDNVDYGVLESVFIDLDDRKSCRLEMTLEAHAGGVFYDITLVLMETSWWGKTSETVLSSPRLISPLGQEASVRQGVEDAVFEVRLIAQD